MSVAIAHRTAYHSHSGNSAQVSSIRRITRKGAYDSASPRANETDEGLLEDFWLPHGDRASSKGNRDKLPPSLVSQKGLLQRNVLTVATSQHQQPSCFSGRLVAASKSHRRQYTRGNGFYIPTNIHLDTYMSHRINLIASNTKLLCGAKAAYCGDQELTVSDQMLVCCGKDALVPPLS